MDFSGRVAISQATINDQTSDASASHETWKNLNASSSIKLTRLNGHDSHPSVSFEPLIEDEESNQIVTYNLADKYTCSSKM